MDGFFVSNFAGKTPFAAVNFIMPLLTILGCIGFMFGTGGSALIAKTLGEGKTQKASELFTLIVTVSALCGIGAMRSPACRRQLCPAEIHRFPDGG